MTFSCHRFPTEEPVGPKSPLAVKIVGGTVRRLGGKGLLDVLWVSLCEF
ncbi:MULTISPECIES: hypothetical protein [unclassified Frankia]|nr:MULTISPECIES: hypothetical protein [unclassified Frankia]